MTVRVLEITAVSAPMNLLRFLHQGRSGFKNLVYHGIYFRTSSNGHSLEERLPALIRDSAMMFETEYNRLGLAWLDLHKTKPGAADELRRLVEELPEGNVVRATAQSLLDTVANSEPVPRRLDFVAHQGD